VMGGALGMRDSESEKKSCFGTQRALRREHGLSSGLSTERLAKLFAESARN